MKRLVSWLFAALLVGAAISYFAAPWVAFRALRAAAAAGDVEGMGEIADITALRQSLRQQLTPAGPPSPPPSLLQDPLGALEHALRQPVQPRADVDAYLTPAAVAALANARADQVKKPKGATFQAGDLLPGLHQSDIRFWDTKRTQIAVVSATNPQLESLFTFERRGWFTWRLVHIRLPAPVAK